MVTSQLGAQGAGEAGIPEREWRQVEDGLWSISFDRETKRVRDRAGMEDIRWLLQHPQQPQSALDMLGRTPTAGQSTSFDDGRQRVTSLAHRLQELTDFPSRANEDERARVERELDAAKRDLLSKEAPDQAKAAKTLSARLGRVLDHIREVHPRLATYLSQHIERGRTLTYQPNPGEARWVTR